MNDRSASTTSEQAADVERQARPAAQAHGAHEPAAQPSPRPPQGPSWKIILLVLAVAGVMLWIGTRWGERIEAGAGRVLSLAGDGHDHAAEVTQAAAGYYTCSMHPWVILPKPGLCPVCHMDLVPLDPSKFTGRIEIDPLVVQNIGVRVAPVESGPVTQTIRTVGTIDYNETAVRDVNIKLTGWIEKLHVNYLGERVEAGQPLFELYSPDLYAAQQEYLLAYRSAARNGAATTQGTNDVLAATRTRLEYFDISEQQVRDLERRGEASKTMTIHSPHTGVVIAKNAFEGMRVEPGTQLYRIADLSTVWVMVTLYEYQLPYVQVGQQAVMSLPYIPGQTFEGKVIYVYPTLDEKTRQVRVRLAFPNEQGVLKPGMFAEVQLKSTLADDRVLAPREAIIDTGQRQVAFVSLGDGKFEPREVHMGVQTEAGLVQVLDGLKPGEMVVTSGQFLLDSESRVRESLAKMITGEMAAEQKAPAAPADVPTESVDLPAEGKEALGRIVKGYLAIGEQLAKDTTAGIDSQAREVAGAVDSMMKVQIPGDEHFWHKHEEVASIRAEALHLVDAKALDKARLAYADLSIALGKFLRAVGVPTSYGKPLEQLHCPMYREGQGGIIWLQAGGSDVRNPYFGKSMLSCFDERKAMPTAETADKQTRSGGDKEQQLPQQHQHPQQEQETRASGADGLVEQPAAQVNALVEAYLAAHAALMKDDLAAAKKAVAPMAEAAKGLPEQAGQRAAGQVAHLGHAGDIEAFRETFATVSEAVIELVKQHPSTTAVAPTLWHMYCPMVKKHWLQREGDFANPYDLSMPECGGIKDTIQARKE